MNYYDDPQWRKLGDESVANYERHERAKAELYEMKYVLGVDRALCAHLARSESLRYMREKARLRSVCNRLKKGMHGMPAPMQQTPAKYPEIVAQHRQAVVVLKAALGEQLITLAEYDNTHYALTSWAARARIAKRNGTPIPRRPTLPEPARLLLRRKSLSKPE